MPGPGPVNASVLKEKCNQAQVFSELKTKWENKVRWKEFLSDRSPGDEEAPPAGVSLRSEPQRNAVGVRVKLLD